MRKRWHKLAAVPLTLAFVAAACSTEDTDSSDTDAVETEDSGAAGGTDGTDAPDGTEAPDGTTDGTDAPAGTDPLVEVSAVEVDVADADEIEVDPALAGTTVEISGPESTDQEAGALQDALTVFAEANEMTINYVGAREFEQQIRNQVGGGNPPDIGIFPQPGNVADFANSGDLIEVPEDVVASVSENWGEDWLSFWQVDGVQYGIPNKSDLKSLVWYLPSEFEAAGYEVPETYTEFVDLTAQMIENGDTPLCVGLESGPSTGWPFTDWVEELVLRQSGTDVYDQWVSHEIPFNSPEIVDAMAAVNDLWATEGMVYASGGSIASTPFGDNAQPLIDGDCMMHRQASFFASNMPEGTEFGEEEGNVNVFYFPSDEGRPVLVAGTSAAAFRDAPEVWAVMEYLGTPQFANIRQAAQTERLGGGLSGFLSAVEGADASLYQPLEQQFLEIVSTGDPARFDASDLMPGEVGSGSFWTQGVDLVTGSTDAQGAADAIEESWPS